LMQMPEEASEGVYEYGKGKVFVVRQDPKEFAMQENGDESLLKVIRQAYGKLEMKNDFYLERGPYVMVSVLDEGAVSDQPLVLRGSYIDLFDPTLPTLKEKEVLPGQQAFLFDINTVKDKKNPQVLAAASRQYEEVRTRNSYSFISKSPAETNNVMRVLLPREPKQVKVSVASQNQWDADTHTLLLQFENLPEGVKVEINW